jgi:tetratricopeptide (TPR) repeat protein
LRGARPAGTGVAISAGKVPQKTAPPGSPTPTAQLALVLTFALLALLSVRRIGSLDVGFHLKAGEFILAGNGWPRNDPFTFTLGDHQYVDMSWGYQVIIAAAFRIFGAPGLVLFHALLVLLLFAILYRTSRLVPSDPASVVLLLCAGGLASEMRFEPRPEMVSWVLLALVLHLLHRRAEGRWTPLWALPALHLVWANVHSLFILGWAALACFLVGTGLRRRSIDRGLLAWSLASVAVTLLNPYGLRGIQFPFTLATRLQEENVFARSIGEFVSPFALGLSDQFPFYPRVPIFLFRTFAALSLLALLPLIRQKRFWCVLLWVCFMPLAAKMIRNIPLVVITCLTGTVWGLPTIRLLATPGLREGPRRLVRQAALLAVIVAAPLLGLRVYHDAYYVASRREDRFGWGWNHLALPIDAARHADAVGLRGPVLNHLNFGGYLMWARPDPVFIDGRLEVAGEAFFNSYREALASEEALEERVRRHGIEWLIFPYTSNPRLLGRLSRDLRWRLAYFDHLAAIFVREGPGAAAFVDPALRSEPGGAGAAARIRSLPGLFGNPRPGRLRRFISGFVRTQDFPSEELSRGLFRLYRGELQPAEDWFAKAIERSGGRYYETYHNLGAVLYRRGRRAEARECYRAVLTDDPRNQTARERLFELN